MPTPTLEAVKKTRTPISMTSRPRRRSARSCFRSSVRWTCSPTSTPTFSSSTIRRRCTRSRRPIGRNHRTPLSSRVSRVRAIRQVQCGVGVFQTRPDWDWPASTDGGASVLTGVTRESKRAAIRIRSISTTGRSCSTLSPSSTKGQTARRGTWPANNCSATAAACASPENPCCSSIFTVCAKSVPYSTRRTWNAMARACPVFSRTPFIVRIWRNWKN